MNFSKEYINESIILLKKEETDFSFVNNSRFLRSVMTSGDKSSIFFFDCWTTGEWKQTDFFCLTLLFSSVSSFTTGTTVDDFCPVLLKSTNEL